MQVCHIFNLQHLDIIPDTFSPTLIPADHPIQKPQPLFSAISEEMIAKFREQYGGAQVQSGEAVSVLEAAAGSNDKKKKGGADDKAKGKNAGGAKEVKVNLSHLPDIARVDLRVGKIVKVWPHPEADKLWCEEIDLGEEKPRTIASGLRDHYKQEEMLGRNVCVVCNLKPRTMKGFESQGMVLCASSEDKSKVEFIEPPTNAKIGERLLLKGVIPDDAPFPVPEVINPAKDKNPWANVCGSFKTDSNKVATFEGTPFTTSAGPVVAPTLANVHIG